MTKLEYTKTDPTGNITVLVDTPTPREYHAAAAEHIMEHERDCEQVGFIEPSDKFDARLSMMGGEFCANATMSLAALIAERRGLNEFEAALEISGAPAPVAARVLKRARGEYTAAVDMPLPESVETVDFGTHKLPVARFPGIYHAIVTEEMPIALAQMLIREWGARLKAAAFGIMLLDMEKMSLTPIVYVTSTDTVVREASCASGTAAAGAYFALKNGADADLTFTEPGGSLRVETSAEGGKITRVRLHGAVRIAARGELSTEFTENS